MTSKIEQTDVEELNQTLIKEACPEDTNTELVFKDYTLDLEDYTPDFEHIKSVVLEDLDRLLG